MDETQKKVSAKMQASNIDEQGNVLYLDEERLARKVVGYPVYKNKANGLGIVNFLVEHVIYMRKSLPIRSSSCSIRIKKRIPVRLLCL